MPRLTRRLHNPHCFTSMNAAPMLRVRALETHDIDLLPVTEDQRAYFRRIIERDNWTYTGTRAFVAELVADKTIVGYALAGLGYPPYFPALSDSTKQLYLASLNVFDTFQRRGFATRVLEFFVEEAKRLGIDVMRAECEKDWRVDLYGRVGLEPVPYKGTHESYPDSHQMLELWLNPETRSQ